MSNSGNDRMFIMNREFVLASQSPRRKELLRQIGLSFTTDPAHIDESVRAGEAPGDYAVRLALDKAREVAGRRKVGVIIAADTIVVVDDDILGKPADADDAGRMLGMLSGRMHRVITGVALLDAGTGKAVSRFAVTNVWFRELSLGEIAAYVATGEPMDKAGAYGIQGKGALLIEKIEGCYANVVGLPIALLHTLLREFNKQIE